MGIIYVMTNPVMPDLVKIGKTAGDIIARRRELSSVPGVPVPFNVHYAGEVADEGLVESSLHSAFADHRINPRREFFRIDPERVVAAIQIANPKDVTPVEQSSESADEEEAAKNEVKRRSRLRLDKIGIPVGAELAFSRDNNIKATVEPDSKIRFEGNVLSLSAAAGEIMTRMGMNSNVSGSVYWTYKGKTLDEHRLEMEEEEAGRQD